MADQFLGWKGVLHGNLNVCEIAGHQQNLLLEPHILPLAKELSSRLTSAPDRHAVRASVRTQRESYTKDHSDLVVVG